MANVNQLERHTLDRLKTRVDLAELMASYGIQLKPVGRNFTGCCPWHQDQEASLVVNPDKQLYNCFGCKAKGDALTFLQAQEQLSFPQAVEKLRSLAGENGAPQEPSGPSRDQLLEKACRHYQAALEKAPEAREYLMSRKLWNTDLYEGFRFGYCDGTLLKTLPGSGPVREALLELGLLNDKGREHFLGCVVVPLFHPSDGLVGFYGRRLSPKARVRHLFLPGPKRGVFGFQALEEASFVYLAEGVFDALSLWLAGLRPVTCAFGTTLPQELERFLRHSSVLELRLCLDSDRAGEAALEKLQDQVGDRFQLTQVLLPLASDPNEVLCNEGPEMLRSFGQCLKSLSEPPSSPLLDPNPELPLTEVTDQGFKLTFNEPAVVYQVTLQPPFHSGRLKMVLRARRSTDAGSPGAPRARSHLKYMDRCDLVSSRSRTETLRGLSRKLCLDKETAELHLSFLLDTGEEVMEALKAEEENQPEAPVLSEDEKAEALEFLRAPDLVAQLLQDMEDLGYVGEEKGKLLVYLVGLSRKLENPLSAIIRSQSGAGKSGLAGLVASLVPPEDVIHYSRVSAHALAYAGKDAYKRKLLLMEERVGGEAADYYIRILQSSHKIRQAVVIKDPVTGQMRTQEFEVEGPIAYIETTTANLLNQENASRCFEVYLDETEEQTRRIHEHQRRAREELRLKKLDKEAVRARHHNAQRLLEQMRVVVPYVRMLSFPSRWLRTRRDNERFLCLIEASALLHQHQRVKQRVEGPQGELTYIEANLEDYRLAYDLARDILRDTLHELSVSARTLLEAASEFKKPFTRRELRTRTDWSQRRIHDGIHELVDMEYLTVLPTGNGNGKAHLYTVAQDGQAPTSPVGSLLHPDELGRRLAEAVP